MSASVRILTLAELEATACLRLTRLLTLNLTSVASEEALCLESLLVFCVNLNERTGDSEAESLALTCEAATVEVSLDIIFLFRTEQEQRLLNHVLQDC